MADEEFSSEEQAAIQEIENGPTEPQQDAEPPAQDAAADDMAPADDQKPVETAEDGDGQGEDQKKGDPGIALQQARQQARESREAQRKLEAALEQQRKNYEALAERIGAIAQGRQQPGAQQGQEGDPLEALRQQKVEEPDPFDDPEGWKAARAHNAKVDAALQRAVQQIFDDRQRTAQATEQQRRQAQAMQQLDQIGLQHKQDFMIEAPDYEEAEAFALNAKAKEYRAFGMNDQQIQQQIRNDVFAITQQAQRLGQNAAQMIYQFAKVRGWQPGMQAGGQPQNDNADMIAQKAAAAQKNRSIGAVGGARPSHGITPEKLMSLSDDDIANFDEDELLKAIGAA